MKNIKVKILKQDFDGTPLFLAKLTQRGHSISSLDDLTKLYDDNITKTPSEALLKLPHDTIQRMCNMTVAIYGLSTKAVSQLRTHATRLTFISTSTQYSEFTSVEDPYVIPEGISVTTSYKMALEEIHKAYKQIYDITGNKDLSSYLLPQGLRKSLIISGNFPAWKYVLSMRLCNRNTREVQYICELILEEMKKAGLEVWAEQCKPKCCSTGCEEGKFSCGKPYRPLIEKGGKNGN